MNYNNYFPASYQPIYPQQIQQPQMQMNQQVMQQPQMLTTPPTIHAEIVQVASREDALNFPVGTGQTQMMIMKDDSTIFVKTAFPNGQINLDEYIRKPKEEVSADKPDFITREEFEQRISELMAQKKTPLRKETKAE